MTSTSYLRFPDVHDHLVAFVAEDDVWLAEIPEDGSQVPSRAWRVTSDRLPAARPRISPDGGRIAWTGRRDGDPEAYSAPVDGGSATRLTFWGHVQTNVRQWFSDTEVLVVSGFESAFRGQTLAYAVPAAGGAARPLPLGTLFDLGLRGPGGAVLLSRSLGRDAASWKRYRGGTAGKLWLDPDGSGEFHRFAIDVDGNIFDPMWIDGRAAFVSDHEGVAELYSCMADDSDLRRHTHDPAEFYARHAATDGTRTVFERAGRLWLLDSLDGEARPLDIRLTGTRYGRDRHPVEASCHLGAVAPDHTGRASAVEVRGTINWLTHKEGPARVLRAEDGVRGRLPTILGDSGLVAWVTDAEGDDALEIGAADGTGEIRRVLSGELSRATELSASPDGRRLAVVTADNRLLLVDVEAGTARTVVSGSFGGEGHDLATGPVFSPDSAWLAWSHKTDVGLIWHIRLADVEALTVVDVTEPRFRDWSPAFTADGKHLAFLSLRTFDPYPEEHVFDYSFTPGTRPYLVPLAETEPSPFAPQLGGKPVGDEGDKDEKEDEKEDEKDDKVRNDIAAGEGGLAAGMPEADIEAASESESEARSQPEAQSQAGRGGKAKKKQPPKTVVDVEGLMTRVVPFPVPAGNYDGLSAAKGGVLWVEQPIVGSLGDSLAAPDSDRERAALLRFDFAKRAVSTLADELDSYAVSGNGERVAVRDGGRLRIQSAESRPDGSERDIVDLDRLRITIDPVAERRQAFHEAWRLQRDNFWRPDMSGVDWDGMRAKYAPLAEAVASSDDFIDLLWELQGELGTSHAYAMGPGLATNAAKQQGFLGVDLVRDEAGAWRIGRILPGDSSRPAARSPLAAPGVAARLGDVVVAIDGRPVTAELGPNPLLAGKAGKPVELTLRRDAEAGKPAATRGVVVIPLRSEGPLRYQAWVADRRTHVHVQSEGRLGYLHLPDQGSPGWAEFHRDLPTQVAKDGLIVDTRGNGGGHTSQLVVEKLIRKPIGWALGRGIHADSYPVQAPRGPVVSVCDEFAGSDGDIINQAFKDHGIPVVGVRTWGGTVGIDGRYRLVDGTHVTQPKYGTWFYSVGYGMENHGVDPTVEVHRSPQDWGAGRDPQLDTAIRIALAALTETPALTPPETPGLVG